MPSSVGSVGRWISSRCPQCHAQSIVAFRSFSSSSATQNVGPESPKYIEIPPQPQQRAPPKPRVKGVLPVPRNLFPRGTAHYKATPKYIELTTPEPQSAPSRDPNDTASATAGGDPRQADYVAWKQRQATARRNNLRTSLQELYERSEKSARFVAARSQQRRQQREGLVQAPQREDEQLTSPSKSTSIRQAPTGSPADPDRAERVEAKRAQNWLKLKARTEERRDAAHTLYMHARNFITTEAQLDTAIDEVFTVQPATWDTNQTAGDNIWNRGPPDAVQTLLGRMRRSDPGQGDSIVGMSNVARLTDERVKKIAEELTGGKM